MKYKHLGSTDIMVPTISMGASSFNNFYKDTNFDETPETKAKVKAIVKAALDAGINYFDVAPWYGNAQHLLAVGLEGVPRSSYYLATKVGKYNCDKDPSQWFDFTYERTIQSVEESLKIFNVDYIDLIQVHDYNDEADKQRVLNHTLRALDELRKSGKVRYIGLNHYYIDKLKELLELSPIKIDTVLTFTHLTLDDTSLLDYIDFFKQRGVGIINAAPLSMGLYTEVGPPDWHTVPKNVKTAVKSAFEYCKNRNVNLTKLALNFSALNECIDTTLISVSSEHLIKENISFLEELSDRENNILMEIREQIFTPLNYRGYSQDYHILYLEDGNQGESYFSASKTRNNK